MKKMRAKLQVSSVSPVVGGTQILNFHGVGGDKVQGGYPADGTDEDNDYARWSPSVSLQISIANPALHDQFKTGDKFYVDFTPADVPDAPPAEVADSTP